MLQVKEEAATEVIVAMVVGLRGHWKLPIAYFLVRRTPGILIQSIIKESLIRTYKRGLTVFAVTVDGTKHNLTGLDLLKANMQPHALSELRPFFDHPSNGSLKVGCILDPPHMIKLVRNLLAKFDTLVWPGKGRVRWGHLIDLLNLEQFHGLRTGTKLTSEHINFKRRKMNVKMAVQSVASQSVADSLRWAHHTDRNGFESEDVLVTAEFIETNKRLFDVLNAKDPLGQGTAAPLEVDEPRNHEQRFQCRPQRCTRLSNYRMDFRSSKVSESVRR